MVTESHGNNDSTMKSECPVCGGKDTLKITNNTDNIPYFGDILETSVLCEKCGYTTSDNICLEKKDPIKYTLEVDNTKLNTRIAKSQTATITIPELGLKVEPGPKSQGYISNIEGVLNRFESAILRALTLCEEDADEDTQNNATYLMQQLNKIKMGTLKTTLIVEDPFGHSVIDDKDALKRLLTPQETEKLETGYTTIEE